MTPKEYYVPTLALLRTLNRSLPYVLRVANHNTYDVRTYGDAITCDDATGFSGAT